MATTDGFTLATTSARLGSSSFKGPDVGGIQVGLMGVTVSVGVVVAGASGVDKETVGVSCEPVRVMQLVGITTRERIITRQTNKIFMFNFFISVLSVLFNNYSIRNNC